MTIKPIRTQSDLEEAKLRLVRMMRENEFGEHDDEIEILSTLAETFESKHVRIESPHPIAAIRFRMEQLGLTARQLEPFIGSRARVSEILSGKRQLSIDMIRALHEGLKIPYASLISERAGEHYLDEMPVPVIDRLNEFGFDVDREHVSSFITSSLNGGNPLALLRKTRTQRASSKTDQSALLLWQAAVLQRVSEQKSTPSFSYEKFKDFDFRRLVRLSQRPDGPSQAIAELASWGVSVVVLPPLPGTFLDGAAMLSSLGAPVVGLTLRFDRVDSFWFTLLHELAHVALHYEILRESREAFVDDMEIRTEDSLEREADELARNALVPEQFFDQVNWGPGTTQDEVQTIATRARVHVSIVAGRWQRDHQNYKKFARLIERESLRSILLGSSRL